MRCSPPQNSRKSSAAFTESIELKSTVPFHSNSVVQAALPDGEGSRSA